jgi:aspartate carbamoyltransferase catalytic subunit
MFTTASSAATAVLPRATVPSPWRNANRCRHLLGIDDLDDDELLMLSHPELPRGATPPAPWGTLGLLFEQPSLRTASGFAASGLRVGLVPVAVDARGHAVRATLDLADELHQLSITTDCVAVRTGEALAGDALWACEAPVINAGDGSNEHPTQALIDLTALRREGLEGRRVVLMGNLRDHRTQHSLARALTRLGVDLTLLSPPELGMPPRYVNGQATVQSSDSAVVDEVLSQCDCVYLTPTRYWNTPDHQGGNAFRLDLARARRVLRPKAVVLHPFPRLDELDASLDHSPYNGYHRQLGAAVPVRARLLEHLLGRPRHVPVGL